MENHYILLYETVADYVEKRVAFREEHLALVNTYHHTGQLLMAGAFDPADGAAFIFKVQDQKSIEDFVHADPYFKNGLILKWHIKKWTVVIGV